MRSIQEKIDFPAEDKIDKSVVGYNNEIFIQ